MSQVTVNATPPLSEAQSSKSDYGFHLPTTTTDQPEERLPVLIIGSAIAGTVFALQLITHPTLRAKYRPIIFDSATTLPGLESFKDNIGSETTGQSGAAIGLTRQAMYPLRQLDLGPELEDIAQNIEELTMFRQPFFGPQDGSQKGVRIMTTSAPPDVGVMGGMWTIERGPLQGLLIKRFLERGGEIHTNKKLINMTEHLSPTSTPIKAHFSDSTTHHGALLIGADGAWSTVRKHLFTTPSPSPTSPPVVDSAWKPTFQNLQIVHGISHAPTTDTKPIIYSLGLRNAGFATWTLAGSNRQYWTIYTAPIAPPPTDRAKSVEDDEALSKEWDMQVYSGGYDRASTEAFVRRYKDVWHPSTTAFSQLFTQTEKFIRVPLYQGLFTRISNVSWSPSESPPKECGKDKGVKGGKGNIALIGDAARVLMPTAGQGAAFAIEDATLLADCVLNFPPVADSDGGGGPDFSEALKEHTRQRLPRYKRIETIASAAARLSVGRTAVERGVRDYLPGWVGVPMGEYAKWDEEEEGRGRDGREGRGGRKRKEGWLESWTSDRWLVGERFEVRERR